MLDIRKRYVMNEKNQPIAIMIDIPTFGKIERILEDYVLGKKMKEVESEPSLDKSAARMYYDKIKKR